MSTYTLPKTVTILGKSYAPEWDTAPDMSGSFAVINIGRTFVSDAQAMDWAFDTFGGAVDHVDNLSIDRRGDVTLKVRPS